MTVRVKDLDVKGLCSTVDSLQFYSQNVYRVVG